MDKNLLSNITTGGILGKVLYKEMGTNEELGLYYKSNGKDYLVENDFGQRYTLTGQTVNSISEKTGYEPEEVMDILYIVYSAYDNYASYLDSSDNKSQEELNLLKKVQSKIVDVISDLITKYGYTDVYTYFNSMNDLDIMTLFNGQKEKDVLEKIDFDLSTDTTNSYAGETEEIVSIQFRQ